MTHDAYVKLWDVAALEFIPDYPGYTEQDGVGDIPSDLSVTIKRRQDELALEQMAREKGGV